MKYIPALAVLVLSGLISGAEVGAAETTPARFDEKHRGFFKSYCVSCHGPEKQKGKVRLDDIAFTVDTVEKADLWQKVLNSINSGEMPPKKEKRPTQAEIAAFVTSLDARIKEGKAARMAARPPVAHYRLSRKEYQNTGYDLLGVRYDPAKPGELNEDTLWHGFEQIGSELSLSPSHVDRYYRAARADQRPAAGFSKPRPPHCRSHRRAIQVRRQTDHLGLS